MMLEKDFIYEIMKLNTIPLIEHYQKKKEKEIDKRLMKD